MIRSASGPLYVGRTVEKVREADPAYGDRGGFR